MNNDIENYFSCEKKNNRVSEWMTIKWYQICDFFKYWIYPGHCLRNLLFRRYDRVKIPQVKPWEYCEPCESIKFAVFELVCNFIDGEERDPIVEWYGEYGKKLDDKYVMDIGKEIRKWWRTDRSLMEKRNSEFLDFYCRWSIGKMVFGPLNEQGLGQITFDREACPKTQEECTVIPDEDWKKFDAVCDDRSKMIDQDFMRDLMNKLETELYEQDQHYLHLAIDIRDYLWT